MSSQAGARRIFRSMRNSEKLLRSLIREIHLREDSIATLTLRDISGSGEIDTLTRVVSPGNARFMKDFLDKKDRQGKLPALPSWLLTRMKRIKERLGDDVAMLASAVVNANDGKDPASALGQLIQGHGQDVGSIPSTLNVAVPEFLTSLALSKRPGSQQENTGRGEGLSILLFGRDAGAKSEPDLIVNRTGYSIKYFADSPSTVKTGKFEPSSDVPDRAADMMWLLNLAKKNGWKPFRARAGSNQITRPGAKELFSYLRDPGMIDDNGDILGSNGDDVMTKINNAIGLWDTTSFSDHPIIALHNGSDGVLRLTLIPKEKALLGTLRWSGPSAFMYEIASPARSEIKTSGEE